MVDINKLDKWAELLLDTGKRNNLINYKDTKTSTVEIIIPSADLLFEKIDGNINFEVYDPKIVDEDDNLEETNYLEVEDVTVQNSKAAYQTQYSPHIKKQNQILIYNAVTNPITALKNIDKKAKEFIEETGVNVAYMAFGFINWYESNNSDCLFKAPILLVPIQFERDSAIAPYFIKSTDDDVIVNPTFSYKMDAEYGVQLPDYSDEGLNGYLAKVTAIVSKLQWTVSNECKIDIFSFLKINMYRDLKDNAKTILSNTNVRILLGEVLESNNLTTTGSSESYTVNPLTELHNVVDADSSQIEAIEMSKSGKSFLLQGPPGTGKSQTITNIIAECLSDGKKVLFVSEKLAALNVVYDKLKQAGLSEFCLELHSHKSNKKDIIADLCHTLRMCKSAVSSKADTEILSKEKMQYQLDAYAEELHKPRAIINKSLYQLYEAYSVFRTVPEIEWTISDISSKGEPYIIETASLLEQYVDYTPTIGYDYKKNPWYGYRNQDTSYQTKSLVKSDLQTVICFLTELVSIAEEIFTKYAVLCSNVEDTRQWGLFFHLVTSTKLITPSLLQKVVFEKAYETLKKLEILAQDILSSKSVINSAFDGDIYKIDGSDCYKRLTKRFNRRLSRFLNQEYKEIISDLRICKKDGKKLSYNEAVTITERLFHYQQKTNEYNELEQLIKEIVGSMYVGVNTDWKCVSKQMELMRSLFSAGLSFASLEGYSRSEFEFENDTFSDFARRLDSCFNLCPDEYNRIAACFDKNIFDVRTAKSKVVLEKCENCHQNIEMLNNWCHFRSLMSQVKENQASSFIDYVIEENVDTKKIVDVFKKRFYYQWIDYILFSSPILSNFNRIAQDKAVNTFSQKDIQQLEINKAKIRAELSSYRPSLDMIAPGSAVSILLREGEKKRKQKSIRTLLSETGELVQRIKPCFLMSPLSVSTFLSSDAIHFDTVVFDEASQIFPQDAIGAIYRADQLIVVGDSKQMPPSNFFNATIVSEDSDDEAGDVTDFESILDLCSTAMQQQRLCWHYRSRYEQLIIFSNKNFYDNSLITFPSSISDAPGIGVDYYYVDGLFDRKSHSNSKEAEFIVDLIYQNVEKYPDRSLGVVAFSVSQQNLIEKLLSKRRQINPEKEFFFKIGLKEPFFIKNLETVQGDERDTIIFSVAYGIDAQGRLLHNFGPLNRIGGERRLNVAVTRAKCNVQLVSSMHHTDIDLKRTSAGGAKLLREYLDFAENGNIALQRSVSVSLYEQFDSDFELEVCEFLRSRGFTVDTQVGCSGFRIDLGLRQPDSSNYVLAIECDGATYHSAKNARDRDRLREEILKRMGWKFYRIWSTDWFRNKSIEQLNLLEAATNALKNNSSEVHSEPVNELSDDDSFEEAVIEHFEFSQYRSADIDTLGNQYLPHNFKGMIKAILEIEAPLSEELLLKRTVSFFDREKVTNVVQKIYEREMRGCGTYGIIRKNGFLYLQNQKDFHFRAPGDITREIKHISPEELAAGIMEILRQNITADKNGLYRSLAQQCGVNRAGKSAIDCFDTALNLLKDEIIIDEEMISIK